MFRPVGSHLFQLIESKGISSRVSPLWRCLSARLNSTLNATPTPVKPSPVTLKAMPVPQVERLSYAPVQISSSLFSTSELLSIRSVFSRRFNSTTAAPDTNPAETSSPSGTETNPSQSSTHRAVGYWYLLVASLVFGIVVLGGLTRLTESGLSIVEWNLIRGMKPPTSEEEWIEEFEKYKKFPEYKLLNRHMTLEEFKFIFYMEWAHRMLGRFIGLSFILPGIYFASRGYMSRPVSRLSLGIATLIGCQGLLGWYMVKSGLSDHIVEQNLVPRVSHYWLAAHLTSAFVIFTLLFAGGLAILKRPNSLEANALLAQSGAKKMRGFAHGIATLVFFTAMSGALVAGLDAGLIYNEFPYMGEGLVPSDMWAYSTPSDRNMNPIPAWRNLLENPSAVQFNHRVLAITTFTSICGLWTYSRFVKLPPLARLATNTVMAVAIAQVTLGITTLIYFVPIPLAAAHQAGSLTLLGSSIWLMNALKRVPK